MSRQLSRVAGSYQVNQYFFSILRHIIEFVLLLRQVRNVMIMFTRLLQHGSKCVRGSYARLTQQRIYSTLLKQRVEQRVCTDY
jgi:hypothetical protein